MTGAQCENVRPLADEVVSKVISGFCLISARSEDGERESHLTSPAVLCFRPPCRRLRSDCRREFFSLTGVDSSPSTICLLHDVAVVAHNALFRIGF